MKQLWVPALATLALTSSVLSQNPALPAGAQGGYFPVQDALNQWRTAHGESWRVAYDDHAQFARMLYGGAAQSAYRPQSDADFFSLARAAIAQSKHVHGVDTAELVEDSVMFLPLSNAGSTDKVTVQFRQAKNGVRVLDGFANVLFDLEGRVLSIDTTAARDIGRVSTTPLVSPERAVTLALDWFADDAGVAPTFVSAPELLIDQPIVGKFHTSTLAWEVNVQHESDGLAEGYYYRVDAADGSQSSRAASIHNDVSGTVQSLATPGHSPDTGSNPPTVQAMPHIRVASSQGDATADSNGNFTIIGATAPLSVTLKYEGSFTNVNNATGSDYQTVPTLNGASGNTIVMNSPATGTVSSQANAFLWVNELRDWTRTINPSDATGDFVATSNVNINSSCNAYYNGASTNYFLPGSGCVNTAYSSVVLHEMGHWYNVRYSSGNGGDGFGEGNADVFSMYVLDDPIVGKDFAGTGNHIRTGLNNRQFCGDCCGGCFGEVHADGEVLMGALWKVRARLKNALGTSAGSLTADTLFNSWMNAYNDGQIKTVVEIHWLTLDDDNGFIGDGTPHYAHIDGGFRDQGFPGFGFQYVHITNVSQVASGAGVGPFTVTADATATFNPPVTSMSIRWRAEGAPSFQTAPMSSTGGTSYSGQIPVVPCDSTIEYYVTGTDVNSQPGSYPMTAPTDVLSFYAIHTLTAFSTGFESGVAGWTHGQISGNDDWQLSSQVGVNVTAGDAGDPTAPATSGTNVWGTDLGAGVSDGLYADDQISWLRSPVFDCSGLSEVHLRFKRWLTCERSSSDAARIRVNDELIWTNNAWTDQIDTSWVSVDFDISAIADGNPTVQVEFRIKSDDSVAFGGWNIDDFELVAYTCDDPCLGAQSYCTGKLGSHGLTPYIASTGSPSFAAQNFVLELFDGTFNKNCVAFWGSAPHNVPFSGGTLCVHPPLTRGPQLVTDALGYASMPVTITSGMIGTTLYYQWWMRDPADPFAIGISDGLEVTFCD